MTVQQLRAELFRREVRMNANEEAEGNADEKTAMRTAYGERLYTKNLALMAVNQPASVSPDDFQGAAGAATIAHAFRLTFLTPSLQLTAMLRDPLAPLDSLCRGGVAVDAFAGLLAAALPKREPVPRDDLTEEQNRMRHDEFLFREWKRQEIELPAERASLLRRVAHAVRDVLEIPQISVGFERPGQPPQSSPPEMYALSRTMLTQSAYDDSPPQIAPLLEERSRHLQEVAAGEAVLYFQRYLAYGKGFENRAYDWNSIGVVTAEPAPAHVKRAIDRCWRAAVEVGVGFLRSEQGRESAGRAAAYLDEQPEFMEQLLPVYRAEHHTVDQLVLRARYQRNYYDEHPEEARKPGLSVELIIEDFTTADQSADTRFLLNPWARRRIFDDQRAEDRDSEELEQVFSENPGPGAQEAMW
eukprot:CAMPEP_0178986546 /NCGR_PEP_ID=MMETSP0795-20121207/2760_1 /TAXON_ID=88552 /ORGANISM="Amoebophrya sp., Strain Ameob2" /LENGTH=413 /DNA_ID=CAMNT_0020677611 /DNA_START=580 /DNA_END=1818 /DNA_ORIENTATION=-